VALGLALQEVGVVVRVTNVVDYEGIVRRRIHCDGGVVKMASKR
jgi:hypothetical protein